MRDVSVSFDMTGLYCIDTGVLILVSRDGHIYIYRFLSIYNPFIFSTHFIHDDF
jgi:hypothetical protein